MKTGFKIFLISILLLLTAKSYGQCGAVLISSDDTIICVPQVVKFKALNAPAGTTFEWNMGSGYISSDSTFSHLFNVAGDYTISLRMTYTDNSKCTIIKTAFIKGKAKPVISIAVSPNVVCDYNDSVILTDNTPKSYTRDWLLNNTLYKNGPKDLKVLYGYPSGYKNLTVFMKDSFGCSAKRTIDSIVYVADSVKINFAADKLNGCIPKLVNFANLTDSANNFISKWDWTFQNGAPSSSSVFQPRNVGFSTVDTFDVTLKVTTKRGCVYTVTKNNYLSFGDSINLNASFSKTLLCGAEPLTVQLLNSRSPAPNIIISPYSYTILKDTAKTKSVSFNELGKYTVYISDEIYGCKSEKTFSNYITVNGPLADFIFDNTKGCVKPDVYTATNISKVNSGVTMTAKWSLYFDSMPNLILQKGSNDTFKAKANYFSKFMVKLVVTGSNGCKDSLIRPSAFIVEQMKPYFIWDPIPACPGENVSFINKTAPGSSKVLNYYQWTFYKLDNTSILFRDTSRNSKLSYPTVGSYSAKLMAYNSLGCKDSITLNRKIIIQTPAPQFVNADSNVCADYPAKYKVVYTDTNYYAKYSHYWLFKHTDSTSYFGKFSGDSVFVSGLWPGKYDVYYIAYSKSGTCTDTFKLKTKFYVSGDRYKVSAASIKGCNPFNTTLTAKRLMSFNFKNNSPNSSSFNWLFDPDTNQMVVANPTSLVSNILIKKAGNFYIGYGYLNTSGCSDSFAALAITAGVKASFSTQQNACVGKPIKMLNASDPDAVKFKWFVKDSASPYTFYPADTAKNPKLTFSTEGYYTIGLVTYGNGKCTDTGYWNVMVNDIKAQFTSSDTLNYCAPIIASVAAKTHAYIFKYSWYFSQGDTITQNLSSVSTLFSENTGPGGANVRLIVDAYGCSDTMEKLGFIKVIGPIPKFDLQNNRGCEKLEVKFTNQSKYYNRFYLEYGDGTFLDSVNFDKHTYQIFDRSLSQQVFKPKLFVIDSLGCLAVFKPKDSVVVLRAPNANFTVNTDTGCADLLITFRNISLGAVSYKWDFEGDGTYDNFTPFPQKYYQAGNYKPVLLAKGLNGCEDKLENKYFIKAYAPPDASFTTSADTVCYKGNIKFTAQSLPANSDIKKWLWDFGNPFTYKDSSLQQNPTYTFTNPYLNQVVLFVTDKHNCNDTFAKFVYVNDTLGLVAPPLNFVTVQNSDMFVNWSKSKSPRFSRYDLYRDNSVKIFIDSFPLRNDTTKVVKPVNVNTGRYCYTISSLDKCYVKGTYATSHCSIFLQVTDSVNKLKLDWVPYVGWTSGVERYHIFRSEAGGPFKLLDSTTNTTYTDKDLCNRNYCYYIVGIQKKGRWRSQSNTVCKSPLYVLPTEPVIPIRTTVLSDYSTYTQWQPYKFVRKVNKYHISRSYAGSSGVNNYATTDSTGFIDTRSDVITFENSYTYTIRAEDHCGNYSPESSISKTMLLKGGTVNYIAKLNWTPYEKWFSGVKQYEIYLRQGKQYNFLASFDNTKNTFDYNYSDSKLDDSICFKVKAIKDTLADVVSYSNAVCLVSDPLIWVPNTFSPNKDGNNEVFIPQAIMIFNNTGNPILDYHLEIFNRWGEKVFESFDVKIGWDGTANGKQCQEGNYMYKLKALGLNGTQNFSLDGVITLLR